SPSPPPRITPPTRTSVAGPAPADPARRRRLVPSRPAPPPHEPDPRPTGLATLTPPPGRREAGPVGFDEPLHLRSQMDIAAELTAVLTTRMKPPPEPPRDLKPSTAIWLLATGIAV